MFDFDELSGALVFFAWLIHPWSDLTITLLYFICLVLPVLVHFFCCVHLAKQQMTCPEYSTSMWYHERATAVLSICNRETHKNDQ